jgi:predicted DNA-binding transcriptional regulator YafY
MAQDYLAIQGSSVPSERAFSSGGLTGTSLRNRLASATFEALQILKSSYKNNHISAAQEAEERIQSYLAASAMLDTVDSDELESRSLDKQTFFATP